MNSEVGEKTFDCVKWTREVRDRISERIRKRSTDGVIRWHRGKRPSNPRLAELYDRMEPAAAIRTSVSTAKRKDAASPL